jgi:hypothetical protein
MALREPFVDGRSLQYTGFAGYCGWRVVPERCVEKKKQLALAVAGNALPLRYGNWRNRIAGAPQLICKADLIGFAQLIKVYGQPTEGEGRYSPAEVVDTEVVPILGNPDPARICTSIVERQNFTIRMLGRRLTRLTNAFSKKWDSLWAAYCLHFAYYNFCRVRRSLRVTPAMEAGIADHIREISELLA